MLWSFIDSRSEGYWLTRFVLAITEMFESIWRYQIPNLYTQSVTNQLQEHVIWPAPRMIYSCLVGPEVDATVYIGIYIQFIIPKLLTPVVELFLSLSKLPLLPSITLNMTSWGPELTVVSREKTSIKDSSEGWFASPSKVRIHFHIVITMLCNSAPWLVVSLLHQFQA